MVGPEAFTEVKYLAHYKQMQALDAIPEIAGAFEQSFRPRLRWATAPLSQPRRRDDRGRARLRCSARSRTSSTSCARTGVRIGCVGIKAFRPWPRAEVRAALADAKRVVVLEKALATGIGGIVSQNVHGALEGTGVELHTAIAGLGGTADHQGLAARPARRRAARAGSRRHHLRRPRPRARRARAATHAGQRDAPARTRRTCCATSALSPRDRCEAMARYQRSSTTRSGSFVGGQPPARGRISARFRPTAGAPTRSPAATAPARAAARRSARATRSTPRMRVGRRGPDRRQRHRLPRGLLDPVPGELVAAALDPLAVRQRAGRGQRYCRGAARPRATRTRASSVRAATAAPWTSASRASRGCSSATTTCSTSVTTTRAT